MKYSPIGGHEDRDLLKYGCEIGEIRYCELRFWKMINKCKPLNSDFEMNSEQIFSEHTYRSWGIYVQQWFDFNVMVMLCYVDIQWLHLALPHVKMHVIACVAFMMLVKSVIFWMSMYFYIYIQHCILLIYFLCDFLCWICDARAFCDSLKFLPNIFLLRLLLFFGKLNSICVILILILCCLYKTFVYIFIYSLDIVL